ncbi:F-box only protein 6 isoform X2 [Crocuta crocuta]
MAPVSINELPENILLEVLTHIPARQLLLCCRLVCSLWRDLIDLVTLWKRKCLREGFVTEDWDQPVADWKIFFFLCSLRRNLLRNPCAEENMTSWQIDSNGGDHWKVESLPGDHGTDFPDSKVKKYFVTSFAMCLKSQLVDLRAEGYWEELLDTFRPDIVVKDWFAARADCGCTYYIRVQLVSADYIVLASFEPPPVIIDQWNDAKWTESWGPQTSGDIRITKERPAMQIPGSSTREAKPIDPSWAGSPGDFTSPPHQVQNWWVKTAPPRPPPRCPLLRTTSELAAPGHGSILLPARSAQAGS